MLRVFAFFTAMATLLFAYLFHEMYWLHRSFFNAEGRYFDPANGVVYVEQSGLVYGLLAAVCLLGTIGLLIWDRKKR